MRVCIYLNMSTQSFQNAAWDDLVTWLGSMIQTAPLPFWRHVLFVTLLSLIGIGVRIIVQHKWLQSGIFFHVFGRRRRQLRRILAEVCWLVLQTVWILWSVTVVWSDDAWWSYSHARNRSILFGSHVLLYWWYSVCEALWVVDGLWLLQFRRLYREQDMKWSGVTVPPDLPTIYTMLTSAVWVVVFAMSLYEWTGLVKEGVVTMVKAQILYIVLRYAYMLPHARRHDWYGLFQSDRAEWVTKWQ